MKDNIIWEELSTTPDLKKDQVHIWKIPLENSTDEFTRYLDHLSADELERANRFRFEGDRNRFVISHALLRHLLANYLRSDIDNIRYILGKQGKPHLEGNLNDSDLHFNLAHSEDMALIGITQARSIGIDVEYIQPIADMELIASRFFSEYEQVQLKKLPEKQKLLAFYSCWTCKEAVIKNMGKGLAFALDLFDIELHPHKESHLIYVKSRNEQINDYRLTCFPVANGYLGAIAVKDLEIDQIRYYST